MKEKFYITTAIAYTSEKPHIGNTYEIILADAIARYKRLRGYDVYFQTGTDEHGQKIQQKAINLNRKPQEHVDEIADVVKSIWDVMDISYDAFIRTSDPIHKEKVSQIFNKLYEQGDIYKGKYEGLYCTPCELFLTETQLVDNKCPDCGREVQAASEEAYFFKLNKYADRLIKYIEEHPDFIQPELRKTEMINNFLKPGLQDLCVTRSTFDWGIPVSFDKKHIIYVWIDALSNYITFLGYNVNQKHDDKYKKYWPADVHLIGKDILRFHTIYWPILLMALGEPLPKKVFGHPWLLVDGGKMSKSKGNTLYADDLASLFGVDAIRYYVLAETPFATDGIITYDLIIERINSDLANSLGNLVHRTISMCYKYFNGEVKEPKDKTELDENLISLALNIPIAVAEAMDDLYVNKAINHIFELIRRCNKYIEESTPWELAKNNEYERLGTIIYNLLESIRFIAVLLQPFMPKTTSKILNQLNTQIHTWDSLKEFNGLKVGTIVQQGEPLYMRINKEEKISEIEKK
ncbi:MAG: methionine--tRNA ligase [Bacilli bacterium]|jgi:methionyl-tRNA synthetase|nr:methionine--tRNA ligase [Bacilli bacterium]